MEIEELFDELEDLSGSDPELDTMSISSTPKPSLRPFFSTSRSLLAPPQSGKFGLNLSPDLVCIITIAQLILHS
jgi:hypothetical protein